MAAGAKKPGSRAVLKAPALPYQDIRRLGSPPEEECSYFLFDGPKGLVVKLEDAMGIVP